MKLFLSLLLSFGFSTAHAAFIPDSSVAARHLYGTSLDSKGIVNCSIATSVASSALTIALKDAGGNTPSAGSPCKIAFRNATATTGTTSVVSTTGAVSVVVSNGSALGCTASTSCVLYVYAINNAGTVVLGVIGSSTLDEGSVQSSTAEGGAGAADSISTLYSTSVQTSKAVRLLARLTITPGASFAWSANSTEVSNVPFPSSERIEWGYLTSACGSTPCTTLAQTPGVSSVSRSATGSYSINFTAGVYSVVPLCQIIAKSTTTLKVPTNFTVSTTAFTFQIYTVNTQTLADDGFAFTCIGYH